MYQNLFEQCHDKFPNMALQEVRYKYSILSADMYVHEDIYQRRKREGAFTGVMLYAFCIKSHIIYIKS